MLAADLFRLPPSLAAFAPHFRADAAPWHWLREINPALAAQAFPVPTSHHRPGCHVSGLVFIHPTVRLPHTFTIIGPAWIGPETEIRPGAFIRGNVIVGARCVLGNSCEFKNCLLLDDAQVPHFSYVGDSVLGNGAHLGAGAIISNLRLDQKTVTLRLPAGSVDTGLRKFGALLGDRAEVGCNALLNPGTILGKRALVMPTVAFGGYLPPATIAKARATVTLLPRRD